MSNVEHGDAVLAALEASMNAYAPGKVPDTPAYPYAVPRPDLGTDGTYRVAGRTKATRYRVPVLVVGNSDYSANYCADQVLAALRGARLNVAGALCTPCNLESSVSVDRDPDVPGEFSGTLTFVFASTPAA